MLTWAAGRMTDHYLVEMRLMAYRDWEKLNYMGGKKVVKASKLGKETYVMRYSERLRVESQTANIKEAK